MGTVGQRACVLLFAIWGPVRSYHACTQCTLYIVCNCIYDAVISCVGNKTYVVLGGHMLYNVNAFNMFTELCYVYVYMCLVYYIECNMHVVRRGYMQCAVLCIPDT